MTVSIQYEPLYGVNSPDRALSSILTIDGFKILLDCGWTSAFDVTYISALAEVAKDVDVVLISHPDIPHVGALPYAVGRCGLTARVISTLPVWRMGLMFMYDTYLSLRAKRDFNLFNLDDVDAAFDTGPDDAERYSLIKYQQHFPLDSIPGGAGIIVTPYPAGHMLGGTVWNIKKGTESIVYAVDFNHRRERHLKPVSFSAFSRPSHLILGSSQISTPVAARDSSELFDHINNVVRGNGNVLIPVDTAGRIIELAIQLSDQWAADQQLSRAKLVVLHELSQQTFKFAKSMIEWMSEDVVKRFDVSRDNIFDFKKKTIVMCQTKAALDAIPGPKVVLASSPSLDFGFSRDLFLEWSSNPRNAVILVDKPEMGTLYSKLYQWIPKNNPGYQQQPFELSLEVEAKVQLSGDELEAWRAQEKARKLQEEQEEARRLEEEKSKEAAKSANEAMDVDAEVVDKDANTAVTDAVNPNTNGAVASTEPGSPASSVSVSDYDEKTEEALTAYLEGVDEPDWTRSSLEDRIPARKEVEKPKWDDYGQVIDTTRFMIGEDPGEGAPGQVSEYGGQAKGVPMELENDQEVIPTKYIKNTATVQVACQLLFVDYAGLSDGDSLKRMVKQVEPRCVVVIKGTREETEEVRQFLLNSLFSEGLYRRANATRDDVVCPGLGEVVDITSNIPVQDLVMKESLVRGLHWSQVSNNAIAHIDAVLKRNEATGQFVLDNLSSVTDDAEGQSQSGNVPVVGEGDEKMTTMDITKSESEMSEFTGSTHPTVFIGTIALNRLRMSLAKHNLSAEFVGGAICVENNKTGAVILVKKGAAQQVEVDGALCEELFIVRDIVYRELIIPM